MVPREVMPLLSVNLLFIRSLVLNVGFSFLSSSLIDAFYDEFHFVAFLVHFMVVDYQMDKKPSDDGQKILEPVVSG